MLDIKRYFGISDRVYYVVPESSYRGEAYEVTKRGWLGFYDWDATMENPQQILQDAAHELCRNLLLFKSRQNGRGYHIVDLDVRTWRAKLEWFAFWDALYRSETGNEPDYEILRDNVLRLNNKFGSWPEFHTALFHYPTKRSSFHVKAFAKVLTGHENAIKQLYPEELRTYGRAKQYASDPNGVFQTVEELETRLPVVPALAALEDRRSEQLWSGEKEWT